MAILSTNETPHTASDNQQSHLDSLHSWCKHWGIKLNQSKSVKVTFTLRRATCPSVFINQIPIPVAKTAKYLGLYLDQRLTWNPHTRLKRQDVNRRYKMMLRLLDNRSSLSLDNKVLLYNAIIKPIWTYGLKTLGFCSTFQPSFPASKLYNPRSFVKSVMPLFYVSNLTLHKDLEVPLVKNLAVQRYQKFHSTL
jgi:hypothetical protein